MCWDAAWKHGWWEYEYGVATDKKNRWNILDILQWYIGGIFIEHNYPSTITIFVILIREIKINTFKRNCGSQLKQVVRNWHVTAFS